MGGMFRTLLGFVQSNLQLKLIEADYLCRLITVRQVLEHECAPNYFQLFSLSYLKLAIKGLYFI